MLSSTTPPCQHISNWTYHLFCLINKACHQSSSMNVGIYRLADQDTNLPYICRHIQRHLGEQTLDAEQSKDLKDVANGDNAKGKYCETVHVSPTMTALFTVQCLVSHTTSEGV